MAIRPLFEEWLERRHGVLTYCLTQVLTGNGKFGMFLCRIRAETPGCQHCVDSPEDMPVSNCWWGLISGQLSAGVAGTVLTLPAAQPDETAGVNWWFSLHSKKKCPSLVWSVCGLNIQYIQSFIRVSKIAFSRWSRLSVICGSRYRQLVTRKSNI